MNKADQKVAAIIQAAKDFGIKAEDIKTQNLNVYQQQEQYWEEGRQKQRPGQWQVSNSIEVILRNVDQAGKLADVLTRTGVTQLYGPNFQLDDTKEAETELLSEAIADARKKAEVIAKGADRTLGKIMSVAEGSQPGIVQPLFFREGASGGGGAAVEPGTGTVYKTVTVVFEIK